jgi:hypothetical protein
MGALPWFKDTNFIGALRKREYLGQGNRLCMSEGVYLYLHELWQDGVQQGSMATLEDWRALLEFWQGQGKDLRHLEIPPELAEKLGVPLNVTKRPEVKEDSEEDMPRARKMDQGVVVNIPAPQQQDTMQNFKWKKRKVFDGTSCGHVECNHISAGYILGTRSTKDGKNGQIWYGPACVACCRKYHPSLMPMPLSELASQRNGASDLALILDLEVGEVLKRLDAAGVDDKGRRLEPLELPDTETAASLLAAPTTNLQAGVLPDGTEVEFRKYDITVGVPLKSISEKTAEAQSALAALAQFEIQTQEQMDYASQYAQRVLALDAELEKQRKAIAKPFADAAIAQQKPFKFCHKLFMEVVEILKKKIDEAYVRAGQVKQLAYTQAEQALVSGDMQAVSAATQQAAAADITLSKGISRRSSIKWEIVNPALVPQELCSMLPDPAKIQWAVDNGYYQLGEGIRVWEEGTIAAQKAL